MTRSLADAFAREARLAPRAKGCAAVALASLTACASFSTMTTARNLPAGATQVYVAPHVLGTSRHDPPSAAPPPDEHGTPTATPAAHTTPGKLGGAIDLDMEIGARYGVSDDVSVAARLWALGGAAEGQLQLRRSPSPDSGVDIAVAAGASYAGSRDDGKLLLLYAPLLVGLNTGGGDQLVLSPKLVGAYLMRTETASASCRRYPCWLLS